jgi:drug/metabolite transporter (DMT)-like permease
LSVIWGGSFFFYKILLLAWPPLTIVFLRLAIAAAALHLILGFRGEWFVIPRRHWGRFITLGILNNAIPFSLIAWSEIRITSGLASILGATTPLFAALIAATIRTGERMTLARSAGVAAGFLGVLVMIGPTALKQDQADLLSQLACLAASLSYAMASFYGRRFHDFAPLQVATGQISVAAVLMFPLALLGDRMWTLPLPGPQTLMALLGISLVSTAAAYAIFFRVLAKSGASNLVLVTFLIPVNAVLLGHIFLEETIPTGAYLGMGLIGLSLALIDGRIIRRIMTKG